MGIKKWSGGELKVVESIGVMEYGDKEMEWWSDGVMGGL